MPMQTTENTTTLRPTVAETSISMQTTKNTTTSTITDATLIVTTSSPNMLIRNN